MGYRALSVFDACSPAVTVVYGVLFSVCLLHPAIDIYVHIGVRANPFREFHIIVSHASRWVGDDQQIQ